MRRRERKVSILLALVMIMQLLLPVYGRDVFAIENGKIVSNLRILPIKKDEYKPGESLAVAGDWKLPNDTEDKTWVAGDQFEIGIPDGITAKPINIQFKDNKTGKILGEGVYNESSRKYIFTFTEEIEGLQGREGGFIMQFTNR